MIPVVLLLLALTAFSLGDAYGHGVGSETFPPVELEGRLVTLEVSSSQSDPETSDDQQISISLIDFDSKITLRDVTFLIKSERGEGFLFEQEFQADHGFIVFNFQSDDTVDSVLLEEQDEGGDFFGSLLGLESRMVNVKGPKLSEGGLYSFDVSILAADGYSRILDDPLVFNAGISIPQTISHTFTDPNFGEQSIDVITYYDEISDFGYDPESRTISFFMPFEWNISNINQTSVVHEEIAIPKDFGDLLVSGFTMHVNEVALSEDIVNIDDFFEKRTVHFIISQKDLLNIFETNHNQHGMSFVITPDRDYPHMSSVTENGQFRILLSWEPENLASNSNAKIFFDVTDIFLKNLPVSTGYDFSVTQGDRVIFEQSGISSDSKDEHNVAEFAVPSDISGIIHLNFNNLDGNSLARTTIPVVIDRHQNQDQHVIPEWIRSNAAWWADGTIDDKTFVQGIEHLIKNKIIMTSSTQKDTMATGEIPEWIRSNAAWWADGTIDDKTFVQGLEFLVENGIIRI